MRTAALSRSMFQTRKPPRAGRPAWKCAEEYKRWLRKLPCARCKCEAGDLDNPIRAAHVDHAGKGTPDAKGASTKVADAHSIPLCERCHREQHNRGWLTFEKLLPLGDGPALAGVYWTEWPGRREWELELGGAPR